MACEVPVVASKVGGLPEVVTDGDEGFLVEPRDLVQMAARAIAILADNNTRKEMGKRARAKAEDQFCSTKIIALYENYYQKILDKA